jgi:hypothetical protein
MALKSKNTPMRGLLIAGSRRDGDDIAGTAGSGHQSLGSDDELGRMNLNSAAARAAVLSRVGDGKVYDLSVEYFVGMPSWVRPGRPPATSSG